MQHIDGQCWHANGNCVMYLSIYKRRVMLGQNVHSFNRMYFPNASLVSGKLSLQSFQWYCWWNRKTIPIQPREMQVLFFLRADLESIFTSCSCITALVNCFLVWPTIFGELFLGKLPKYYWRNRKQITNAATWNESTRYSYLAPPNYIKYRRMLFSTQEKLW